MKRVLFILIFILIPISIIHSKDDVNRESSIIIKDELVNPEVYTFYYNGMSLGRLNGANLESLKNLSISGKIEFYKNEVRVYSGNKYEIFLLTNTKMPQKGIWWVRIYS